MTARWGVEAGRGGMGAGSREDSRKWKKSVFEQGDGIIFVFVSTLHQLEVWSTNEGRSEVETLATIQRVHLTKKQLIVFLI